MPIGVLLATIVEWDAPGLIPVDHIDDAAAIQREHMVISAFKRDLIIEGPLARHLSQPGRVRLRHASLAEYQGPLGKALSTFAAACLEDTGFDFGPLLEEAAARQKAGHVAADVPTLGVILSSSWAALGADGLALFDRDLVRAALISSACLRALLMVDGPAARSDDEMLPPSEASATPTYLRPTLDLGFAVRNAQLIAERIAAGEALDPAMKSVILGYLSLAERRFRRDGYDTFANLLCEFRLQSASEPAPRSPTTSCLSV